jgi:hypothetical protein
MSLDPVLETFLSRVRNLGASDWEQIRREHRREYGLSPRSWLKHVRRARARATIARLSDADQAYSEVVQALQKAVSAGHIPDSRIDGAFGVTAAAAAALAARDRLRARDVAILYEPFEVLVPLRSITGR